VRRGFENGDGLFWEIQLQSLTGSSLIFANSVFSTGFNSKFTTFNEVSLMTIRAHGEDLLNKPLSLTAHPLQTQIINSSIHATTFRRRLHTSHGLLLTCHEPWWLVVCCRYCQFLQPFGNTPIYRFGHVYK